MQRRRDAAGRRRDSAGRRRDSAGRAHFSAHYKTLSTALRVRNTAVGEEPNGAGGPNGVENPVDRRLSLVTHAFAWAPFSRPLQEYVRQHGMHPTPHEWLVRLAPLFLCSRSKLEGAYIRDLPMLSSIVILAHHSRPFLCRAFSFLLLALRPPSERPFCLPTQLPHGKSTTSSLSPT
eukprot:2733036-Pleurochrysis_carterae.AAC.2